MSIERLASLEARVERILLRLDALARQLAALAQQLWQRAGDQSGGGGGPERIRIPSGIAAGSIATPSTASAFLLNPDGTDGTSITLSSQYTTAVTGNKYGWAQLVGSDYFLIVADC